MYWVKTPWIIKKLLPRLVWNKPSKQKIVYLTFDDGPHPEVTIELLDILKTQQIKASFFCLGSNAEKHPKIIDRIRNNGHFIGNHGWKHLDGWKVSHKDYLANINRGGSSTNLKTFRPPYGRIPFSLLRRISRNYNVVMWDILSGDFDAKISPERCLNNVVSNVTPGSIIVFHDNEKSANTMLQVIPKLIEELSKQSYRFEILD